MKLAKAIAIIEALDLVSQPLDRTGVFIDGRRTVTAAELINALDKNDFQTISVDIQGDTGDVVLNATNLKHEGVVFTLPVPDKQNCRVMQAFYTLCN